MTAGTDRAGTDRAGTDRAGTDRAGTDRAGTVRVSAGWLALREPADAAARATDLVHEVQAGLRSADGAGGRAVIHDLGCGTGSMGRWLAPRLTGAQHWVLYDRDADLLAHAARDMPSAAADGATVTVETRQSDITRLDREDLAGASLITASALLDMLTVEELERFVASCSRAGCPALVTLSVTGRVDLAPVDPLDERIGAAFNAHQRRTADSRRLLGPDAVDAAVDVFDRFGNDVLVRPSPWRLDAARAALATAWFAGWMGAATEQQPDLAITAATYARRRHREALAGRLSVTVEHRDLLARPR